MKWFISSLNDLFPVKASIICCFTCSVISDSSATPWIVAHQAPLSMGLSRQGFCSGLPFPSPGDLLKPGIEPASPTLAGRFFTTESPGKPRSLCNRMLKNTNICPFLKIFLNTYLKYIDRAGYIDQWSPAFLAPETGFLEDSFSTDQGRCVWYQQQ